jgi:hypothetical protein
MSYRHVIWGAGQRLVRGVRLRGRLSYIAVTCRTVSRDSPKAANYSPLKCCSSLISRRARLARIFLLKTLVTFLMATPSPDWLLVAALRRQHNVYTGKHDAMRTRQCHRRPDQAPW